MAKSFFILLTVFVLWAVLATGLLSLVGCTNKVTGGTAETTDQSFHLKVNTPYGPVEMREGRNYAATTQPIIEGDGNWQGRMGNAVAGAVSDMDWRFISRRMNTESLIVAGALVVFAFLAWKILGNVTLAVICAGLALAAALVPMWAGLLALAVVAVYLLLRLSGTLTNVVRGVQKLKEGMEPEAQEDVNIILASEQDAGDKAAVRVAKGKP